MRFSTYSSMALRTLLEDRILALREFIGLIGIRVLRAHFRSQK